MKRQCWEIFAVAGWRPENQQWTPETQTEIWGNAPTQKKVEIGTGNHHVRRTKNGEEWPGGNIHLNSRPS